MNTSSKEILNNCLKASLGLVIFGIGLYLVIQANLGAAPWDVLFIGISEKTGILYGNVSIISGIVLIAIDVFILKESIGLGTLIDAVLVGKTVDLLNWTGILPSMNGSYIVRILTMLAGFFIEGCGQYIYMKCGLGYGPKDTLQIGLGRKLSKLNIGTVNVIIQAVVLILGILMGGPFGIGSLIAPLGMGFAQQMVFDLLKFDPKAVKNQNLIESFRILTHAFH